MELKTQYIYAEHRCAKINRYSEIFNDNSDQHQRSTEQTSETDAEFVEDETSKEEHQQEDIDESVASREESVVASRPSKTTFRDGFCENALQWREQVGDVVAHHHSDRHDDKRTPTCLRRVVEFLCD